MNECYKEQYKIAYGKDPGHDLPMTMFAREWAQAEFDDKGNLTKKAMLNKAKKDSSKAEK